MILSAICTQNAVLLFHRLKELLEFLEQELDHPSGLVEFGDGRRGRVLQLPALPTILGWREG